MEKFVDFCKNYIIEHIERYDGVHESSEIGYLLTEGMNCDGTFTYSRYEARQYLNEWVEEAAEYFEYEKSNFGEVINNPFDNPEAYTVCMVIRGVESILLECPTIEENESIDLDDEKIVNKIIEEVNEVNEINF